jgi:protein-disulfide isomerase
VRGNLDTAKVVVVEYSDLECPACQYYHPIVKEAVESYENGEVAWIYRHFPLVSIHPKAQNEAEAAECVAELGGNDAFWKFVDRIYEVSPMNNGLDLSTLPDIAELAGVDRAAFSTCYDSGKYKDAVSASYAEAVALGAQGTPFSVIIAGDTMTPIEGSPNDTATMIDFINGLMNQ